MKADIWSVGVVLYQMVYGKCPFESKSIAKLIKMLEDQDVVIPDQPKISPTLEKLLRKILVKDYNYRIDWEEFFKYTITESGEIYAPGVTPGTTQFGLRQSIRNSSGFGQGGSGLNFMRDNNNQNNSNSNTSTSSNTPNTSMNDSSKGTSPLLSPKMNKLDSKDEDARQYLMKKRSPTKMYDDNKEPSAGVNTSINYKGDHYSKNDRSNRFELLLKNHAKCSTLNQMVLDMFKLEQNKCIYIAYYLLKSIEKELAALN